MTRAEDVQRYADAIMAMIKEDQDTGQVPRGVCSWDELDDSVDVGDYYRLAQMPAGTRAAAGLRDAVHDEVGRRLAGAHGESLAASPAERPDGQRLMTAGRRGSGRHAGEEAEWMRSRSRLPRGVLVAAGPVVLVAAGIVGYLSFGYSPWTAVAMTLLTLTTVGFAPGAHLSIGALVFSAVLAVLGVGLFVVILGLAATAIVDGRVSVFSRSRRMRRRLVDLRGHFIVCAYGRVGRAIAAELETEGVPFVVVDSKAELEPDLERDGRCYLIGDASDEAVLRKAGIERARALICAVDSDAENVFITIVARSLSPGLLIVARAARHQSADRLHRAGATHVVSPYVTSGTRMANLALRPHVVEFFDLAGAGQPGLRLEELAITEGSPLAGRSLRDLRGPAVPLLIRHPSGQLVANPARELQLQAGDVLVLFGQASDLNPLDRDQDTGAPSPARHMPGRGSPPRP